MAICRETDMVEMDKADILASLGLYDAVNAFNQPRADSISSQWGTRELYQRGSHFDHTPHRPSSRHNTGEWIAFRCAFNTFIEAKHAQFGKVEDFVIFTTAVVRIDKYIWPRGKSNMDRSHMQRCIPVM